MSDEQQIAKSLQRSVDLIAHHLGRTQKVEIRARAEGARTMVERIIEDLNFSAVDVVDLSPIEGAIGEAQFRNKVCIRCRSPLVKEALNQVRTWRVDLMDRQIKPDWAEVLRLENDLMRMERNLSAPVFPFYMMARTEIRALKGLMHRGGNE